MTQNEEDISKEDLIKYLKYWRKRCELAELYIYESPCDPDITAEQFKAYTAFMEFKGDDKRKGL